MACKCGSKSNSSSNTTASTGSSSATAYTVKGNYKYLTQTQLNARLAVFKKLYCQSCEFKTVCDYVMYEGCDKVNKGG